MCMCRYALYMGCSLSLTRHIYIYTTRKVYTVFLVIYGKLSLLSRQMSIWGFLSLKCRIFDLGFYILSGTVEQQAWCRCRRCTVSRAATSLAGVRADWKHSLPLRAWSCVPRLTIRERVLVWIPCFCIWPLFFPQFLHLLNLSQLY